MPQTSCRRNASNRHLAPAAAAGAAGRGVRGPICGQCGSESVQERKNRRTAVLLLSSKRRP